MHELVNPPAIVEQAPVDNLIAVKNLISRYAQELRNLKDKRKHLSEQLKNLEENDSELCELEEEAKPLIDKVKFRKRQIKQSPEATELQMKRKEFGEEESEIKQALSDQLLMYYQLTGSRSVESPDGSEIEFVTKASIKPKQLALFG